MWERNFRFSQAAGKPWEGRIGRGQTQLPKGLRTETCTRARRGALKRTEVSVDRKGFGRAIMAHQTSRKQRSLRLKRQSSPPQRKQRQPTSFKVASFRNFFFKCFRLFLCLCLLFSSAEMDVAFVGAAMTFDFSCVGFPLARGRELERLIEASCDELFLSATCPPCGRSIHF